MRSLHDMRDRFRIVSPESHGNRPIDRVMIGALAGLAATVPMTVAASAILRILPRSEQYSQDPRRLTSRILRRMSLPALPEQRKEWGAALIPHFAYGTACGAVYGWLGRHIPLPTPWRGMTFATLVWAGSYAGWIPALRLLPSPAQRPFGRNVILIASHLVWGLAAEALVDRRIDRDLR